MVVVVVTLVFLAVGSATIMVSWFLHQQCYNKFLVKGNNKSDFSLLLF